MILSRRRATATVPLAHLLHSTCTSLRKQPQLHRVPSKNGGRCLVCASAERSRAPGPPRPSGRGCQDAPGCQVDAPAIYRPGSISTEPLLLLLLVAIFRRTKHLRPPGLYDARQACRHPSFISTLLYDLDWNAWPWAPARGSSFHFT
jgi:hypothetical protein